MNEVLQAEIQQAASVRVIVTEVLQADQSLQVCYPYLIVKQTYVFTPSNAPATHFTPNRTIPTVTASAKIADI